jgi:hypothetical protein
MPPIFLEVSRPAPVPLFYTANIRECERDDPFPIVFGELLSIIGIPLPEFYTPNIYEKINKVN